MHECAKPCALLQIIEPQGNRYTPVMHRMLSGPLNLIDVYRAVGPEVRDLPQISGSIVCEFASPLDFVPHHNMPRTHTRDEYDRVAYVPLHSDDDVRDHASAMNSKEHGTVQPRAQSCPWLCKGKGIVIALQALLNVVLLGIVVALLRRGPVKEEPLLYCKRS
jgi:hypothetical protein